MKRCVKPIVFLVLALALISSSIMVACSTPATPSTSPTATTPAATQTGPTKENPLILRVATGLASTHVVATDVFTPWIKEVEKRTDGRIKGQFFPGGALVKSTETLTALQNDIVDICEMYPGYFPGVFNVSVLDNLAGMSANAYVPTVIGWEMWANYYKPEWDSKGVMLAFCGFLSSKAFTTIKPLNTLEDFKGRKIRSGDAMASAFLQELGAVPVTLASSGIYEGLQKGLIDGAHYALPGSYTGRFYEVAKYVNTDGIGSAAQTYAFNPKTWAKIPADLQKVIYQLNLDASWWLSDAYMKQHNDAVKDGPAKGWTFNKFSDSELAKLYAAADKVGKAEVAKMDKAGHPATAFYNKWKELDAKYGKWTRDQCYDYFMKNIIPMEKIVYKAK